MLEPLILTLFWGYAALFGFLVRTDEVIFLSPEEEEIPPSQID